MLMKTLFEGPTSNKHYFHGSCWEHQLMTDRALDLTKALREAQLQYLEASLSAKCAVPPVKSQKLTNEKMDTSHVQLLSGLRSLGEK